MILNNSPAKQVSFGALPVAEYKVKVTEGSRSLYKKLTVYEAEPKDKSIIKHMLLKLASLKALPTKQNIYNYVSHGIIIKKALIEMDRLLDMKGTSSNNLADRAKIFMAVCDNQLCGVAVSNIPKVTHENNIVYSNRSRINETELDWLTTWPISESQQKIKGTGKILLAHVFDFVQSLRANTMYIRSEHPKHTNATPFYKSMGCIETGPAIPCDEIGRPVDISRLSDKKEKLYSGLVIPMEISQDVAAKKASQVFEEFSRQKLKPDSVNPEEIIDFNDIRKEKLSLFRPIASFKRLILQRYLGTIN